MIATIESAFSPSIDLDMTTLKGQPCMRFVFKGHFNQEICQAATSVWSQKFDSQPNESYDLLWDCTQMDGFDYDARNDWMETMTRYSERINSIHVVSNSILIRGAARVMGKFTKYDMKVYKTLEELE